MTNTTPSSICSAIHTLITNLTPIGTTPTSGAGTETAFGIVADDIFTGNPDDQPEADLDRQYMVDGVESDSVAIMGGITSNLVVGTFTVSIGHQIGYYRDSRDRRANDILQIITQLIKNANRPTGVNWIRHKDTKTAVIGESKAFWWTVITFNIEYFASNNYGG